MTLKVTAYSLPLQFVENYQAVPEAGNTAHAPHPPRSKGGMNIIK